MTIGAFGAIRADKHVTDCITGVKSILVKLDDCGITCIAKLHMELGLFDFFSWYSSQSFCEARFSLRHWMSMRAEKISLLVLLAAITLLVHVEVTYVHAGEIALTNRNTEPADLAGYVFTHIKVAVITLAWLCKRCMIH